MSRDCAAGVRRREGVKCPMSQGAEIKSAGSHEYKRGLTRRRRRRRLLWC